MNRSVIAGTGSYLPDPIVTNQDLGRGVGLSPEEIFKRTGIRERRRAAEGAAASDLATRAAERALEAASIQVGELDLIIVATTSPDRLFPSTACQVQKNLKAPRVPAFDLNASCSGFLYALHVADAHLQSGQVNTALVIASEVKSRFVDPNDPETAFLFGDGAGAVVLRRDRVTASRGPKRGILWTRLFTDGSRHEWIRLPAGGSRLPTTLETLQKGENSMILQGGRVFRAAVREMTRTFQLALEETGFTAEEFTHFFFHQANLRILRKVAGELALPSGKIPVTLDRYGNTSSASIPITWDETVREGKVHPGDLLYLGTFGGGLTWGGMVIRW